MNKIRGERAEMMTPAETKKVLALDIGGTKVMAGVVDETGTVLAEKWVKTDNSPGPHGFIEWLISLGREVMAENGLITGNLAAVGVTAPGLVDSDRGIMLYGPHTGWRDVPFGPRIGEAFGLPWAVENDVNACALGEMIFGAARDGRNFAWVTVSTGIGGGIVIDGKVYGGSSGIAGEFGHLKVADGPRCDCGNMGCVEAVASGSAIARRAAALIGQGEDLGVPLESATAERLAQSAKNGNPGAIKVFEETGSYLGRALSYVVNILNPGMIVLGGGVSQSAELFMPSLKNTLESCVISDINKKIPVVKTQLGYRAGLMGAAAIGLRAGGLK